MSEDQKQPVTLVINARGEIKDGANLLTETELTSYNTPEMKAKLRDMYKSAYGSGRRELRRKPKMVNDHSIAEDRRDFAAIRPVGMSAKDFNRMRKQNYRKMKKQALRQQRSINHGHQTV